MSYIDIAFIVITVLMIVMGACRGLIVSLLSTFKYIIGIPLSFFLSDLLHQRLYNEFVKDIVYNTVFEQLSESQAAGSLTESINSFVNEMPEYFANSFDISRLGGLSVEDISRSITDSLLEPIALTIIRVIVFLVVFVVFCVIISILIAVFSKLQKKEHAPLKKTNSLLGGVFGLLRAILFIITISTIIGYISTVIPQDNSFIKQVDDSYALEFINTYNPFLTFK